MFRDSRTRGDTRLRMGEDHPCGSIRSARRRRRSQFRRAHVAPGWLEPGTDRKFFPLICNNEVWSSADGADWTLVKGNTFTDSQFDTTSDWEGRHTAGYAVYKDKMWIIGGDCQPGSLPERRVELGRRQDLDLCQQGPGRALGAAGVALHGRPRR